MAYDQDNIFAKILRGDVASHKIYEDNDTFSFLDVMPQSKGHALVIPKAPSENILTADTMSLGPLMTTVQLIARAAMEAFQADGITIQQFNQPAGGQTVFHTHFHVLPRFEGVGLKAHSAVMEDQDVLEQLAEAYKGVLDNI